MGIVNTSVLTRTGRTTVSARKVSYWTATDARVQIMMNAKHPLTTVPRYVTITMLVTTALVKRDISSWLTVGLVQI